MTQTLAKTDPWTPERERLLAWLAQNAPALAPLYEAAIRLLSATEFPGRTHLLSHLVREIANGLPQAITGRRVRAVNQTKALETLAHSWRQEFPVALSPTVSPDGSTALSRVLFGKIDGLVSAHEQVALRNRDKTALLFDALRPGTRELGRALEPVIRDWMKVIAWFQSHTHVRRDNPGSHLDPADAELERQFRHFEDGLRGITEGFFGVLRVIDEILQTDPPSVETVDRLIPFLGGAEQLRHFFQSLDDPAWLQPLKERAFFKAPPEPIADEIKQTVTHARWPALSYLVRMAGHQEVSRQVADILVGIETNNVLVLEGIADAALRLPARSAARLAPHLVRGLRHRSLSLLPKKVSALAESLATSGEQATARRLLKELVHVVPDPSVRQDVPAVLLPRPRMRVRGWALHELLDQNLSGIVRGLGMEALAILCSALDRALRLSRSKDTGDLVEDYSYIWRPSLTSDDRRDEDPKELLVTGVLRVAEQLAASPRSLEDVLTSLESHSWVVFRRLALHLLMGAPLAPRELTVKYLLDRSLFEKFDSCREYRMLLQSSFGSLTHEEQSTLLAWIDALPDADSIRISLRRWSDEEPTDVDVAHVQRRWQWSRLGPLEGHLDSDWTSRFDELVREFGPPTPPDRIDRITATSVGQFSPHTRPDLRVMGVEGLIAFLRHWQPSPNEPSVTPQGLAMEIQALVRETPEEFAERADLLVGLGATYIRAALTGLSEGIQQNRSFDASKLLGVAKWVTQQPVKEPEPGWSLVADPDWGWSRGALLRLLRVAMDHTPSAFPFSARPEVWDLIQSLTHDPSVARRAEALETAVRYVFWIRQGAGSSPYADGTLDDVSEVRTIFDAMLASSASRSAEVHQAFGHQIPWLVFLDETWLRASIPRIFPADQRTLWQAAWRGYLHSGANLSVRVFAALSPIYGDAVERLAAAYDDRNSAESEGLADHLALFYGHGALDAQGQMALLDRFFAKADLKLRRHFLWFVGQTLRERHEPPASAVTERFQSLWRQRRKHAAAVSVKDDELAAFGNWVACRAFDDRWTLEELEDVVRTVGRIDLDYAVVERLAELAVEHLPGVIRSFVAIIQSTDEPSSVYGWLQHVPTILGAGLRSGDPVVRGSAIAAFHRLGSLGFRSHELLPFSSDLADPSAIPYFTWDAPMTIAELREHLAEDSAQERARLLAMILREAKDTDVWTFTTPKEVLESWHGIEPHLGRRRRFWQLLIGQWREQGLLARL